MRVSQPEKFSAVLALVLAVCLADSATAQINNLRGQRLEQFRRTLDQIAERTEARARRVREGGGNRVGAGGLGLSEISVPGQQPLRRLVLTGWNIMSIPVTTTVMTTPIAGFNDVTDPQKYRQGRQLIDSWLATTRSKRQDINRTVPRSGNPLEYCFSYLQAGLKFIEGDVRDCQYVLYKRERINGRLQQQQQLLTRVRFQQNESGATQLSEVFIEYLAPESHAGRRIIYKAGEHDGKMLVREGSGLARHLTLKISPESWLAKRESQYSITDTSPLSAIRRLMRSLQDTIRIDPKGDVTEVRYYKDSKVGGRSCVAIVIDFLEPWEGLERRRAIVFVDSENYVPLYLAAFAWPDARGEEPPLQEEFVYKNLQYNVGLKDSDLRLENPTE